MFNLDKSRIEGRSLQSQGTDLSWSSVLQHQDLARIVAFLSQLEEEKLQILLAVSEQNGIGAKALGQKIYLSRYAALAHAKELVKIELLVAKLDNCGKTGIRPGYYFYLKPGLTKHMIELALELKSSSNHASEGQEIKLLPEQSDNKTQERETSAFENKGFEEANLPSPDFSQVSEQIRQLSQYLLQIRPSAKKCLSAIDNEGVTASALSEKLLLDYTTVNKYLKQLFDDGWLTRTKLTGIGRGMFLYFLAPGLTTEGVKEAIEQPSIKLPDNLQSSFSTISDLRSEDVMPTDSSTPQQSSDYNTQSTKNIIEIIKQLLMLHRQAAQLEEQLRTIGGKEAEELIATLRSERF